MHESDPPTLCRLRPLGSLVADFVRARHPPGGIPEDEPASDDQYAELVKLFQKAEMFAKELVGGWMVDTYGADWRSLHCDELPDEVVEQGRVRSIDSLSAKALFTLLLDCEGFTDEMRG